MKTRKTFNLYLLSAVIFSLVFSLLKFEVVRAEGEVPEEPPAVTQLEPEIQQETQEPSPESGETDSAEGDDPAPITPTINEPAELVVLDTQGDPVPLASTAALEALQDPDPYFFKNGVKYEFTAADCNPSEDEVLACDNPIQAALDYLAGKCWVPDNNKVFIEAGNFDTAAAAIPGITLDGGSWLKGAPGLLIISGAGSGDDELEDTIITGNFNVSNMKNLTLSGFSLLGGLSIAGNTGSLTLNDIAVTGSGSDGIKVENHTGSVKLEKVAVTDSTEDGAEIQATGTVQVLESSFSQNDAGGLVIITPSNILLNKVAADNNLGGDGLNLNNLSGTGTIRILSTLGTSSASGNTAGFGLSAASKNSIVINGLNASSNLDGAVLNNLTGLAGISSTGSSFNGNTNSGVAILTNGNIRLEKISASGNLNGNGLSLDNTSGLGSVTILNGQFESNQGNGLVILTKGYVTLNQVNANSNNQLGASINNDGTLVRYVRIASSLGENTFNLNGDTGLKIVSHGAVTLNNVAALMNILAGVPDTDPDAEEYLHGGIVIDNTSGTAGVRIVGANVSFNSGNFTIGLNIDTNGAVYLSKLTANNNHWAADINNLGSMNNATGISIIQSTFNNNANVGISATTFGNIVVNNINAIGNQGPRTVVLQNVVGSIVGVRLLSTLGDNLIMNNAGIGLEITTAGNVILSRMNVSNNGAIGANLPNQIQGIGNVTVTDSFFDNNGDTGLIIQTEGVIRLVNVSASNNGGTDNSNGAYLGGGARSVAVIRGKFNGNTGSGLVVIATGRITLNSVLANDNAHAIPNPEPNLAGQFSGIFLQNSCIDCIAGVTITNSYYSNEFNRNTNISLIDTLTTAPLGIGINVRTYGPLIIRGVSASDNGQHGAYLINSYSELNNVSILNSQFESNRLTGMWVQTLGNITISNVVAGNSNMQTGILYDTEPANGYKGGGAYLVNVGDFSGFKRVTVLNSRFDNNDGVGLRIISNGAIRLVNVTASNNVTSAAADPFGAYISNFGGPPEVSAGISITGSTLLANQFNNNALADGLYIRTTGRLVLNNIAASGNGKNGIFYSNPNNTNSTILNTIVTNNNQFSGLFIATKGSISGYGISANQNGAGINQAAELPYLNLDPFLGAAAVYITNTASTTGTNGVVISRSQFNENFSTGLRVYSNGNITVNNIQAIGNRTADPAPPAILRIDGAYLQNNSSPYAVSIRVLSSLGSNRFDNNRDYGLHILARQNISISKATAIANGILDPLAVRSGMNLVVTAPASVISFSCVGVTSNGLHGIWVEYRAVGGTGKLVLLNSFIGGNSVAAPGENIYIDPAYSTPTIIQSGAYCSGW